jgi:hypothetical protein
MQRLPADSVAAYVGPHRGHLVVANIPTSKQKEQDAEDHGGSDRHTRAPSGPVRCSGDWIKLLGVLEVVYRRGAVLVTGEAVQELLNRAVGEHRGPIKIVIVKRTYEPNGSNDEG